MKLRNKKTGEILDLTTKRLNINSGSGNYGYGSLAELNEEWEDCEEPKGGYIIDPMEEDCLSADDSGYEESDVGRAKELGIWFETEEEAEKAIEKLKAWKRLKDKRFQFHGHNALGFGEITFSLDFEDMDNEGEIGQLRHDLDLLFGVEK